jgi:4-alpha-glucanotransferase
LKEAADYAHKKEVVLKGDIPSVFTGMVAMHGWHSVVQHVQAGAPPDDFAVKGQNWGFPLIIGSEWQDGFAWWRQRFEQMSKYSMHSVSIIFWFLPGYGAFP